MRRRALVVKYRVARLAAARKTCPHGALECDQGDWPCASRTRAVEAPRAAANRVELIGAQCRCWQRHSGSRRRRQDMGRHLAIQPPAVGGALDEDHVKMPVAGEAQWHGSVASRAACVGQKVTAARTSVPGRDVSPAAIPRSRPSHGMGSVRTLFRSRTALGRVAGRPDGSELAVPKPARGAAHDAYDECRAAGQFAANGSRTVCERGNLLLRGRSQPVRHQAHAVLALGQAIRCGAACQRRPSWIPCATATAAARTGDDDATGGASGRTGGRQ